MVQQSETAGRQTEQSPLLGKPGNTSDQGGTYVSIEEVVDGNGTTVFKSATDDEERQSQDCGEVEEVGFRRGHVVRIISVLLIGELPLFPSSRHLP